MTIRDSSSPQSAYDQESPLSVIVVDDDDLVRETFEAILKDAGYRIITASNANRAMQLIQREAIDIAVVDLVIGEDNGIDLIKRFREIAPQIVSIMVTGYGTIERAVEAMQAGAWDFITKPFSPNMLIEKLERIKEYCVLRREHDFRRKVLNREFAFSGVVGPSTAMQGVYELVLRSAQSNLPVLIQGETGTGKEFIAEAIHLNSKRKDKPYVVMDCTSIPTTLMESALFGCAKGAFTGAVDRKGLLETAHLGTLFLDEVGEIDIEMQPKLLRCLETGRFRPVGATKEACSNFRIICATNRDLLEEVEAGRFRRDLYYRLSAMQIHVPLLRERPSDIPILAKHFAQRIAIEHGRPDVTLSPDAMAYLAANSWPGNIRQLRFVIESAFFNCPDERIGPENLHIEGRRPELNDDDVQLGSLPRISFDQDYKTYREEANLVAERAYLEALLGEMEGDVRKAAQKAGITREALYRIMAKCEVSASDYREG